MKNMHKLLVCSLGFLMLIIFTESLQAQYRTRKMQRFEFSVTGSYLFAGVWPVSNGELNILNTFGVGSEISYKITPSSSTSFSYSFNPSELRFRDYGNSGEEAHLFDMDIHYFYLNYIMESQNRNAVPYFLVGIGGAMFDPKDAEYSSEFRGATCLGGGIKIFPSRSFGIKFQARLLLPVSTGSSEIFTTETGGTGYVTGAVSALVQSDLSLGFVIRF